MKKHNSILLIFFFFTNFCFGQITFEKGYFIDNNEIRTTCLIKNYDWRKNPIFIEYKTTDTSTVKLKSITEIKEFGIDNFSRYIRSLVKIDRSSQDINTLSRQRNPEWKEETLFLKELICGKASLYMYVDDYHSYYFFNTDGNEIKQLVYKEYFVDIKGQYSTETKIDKNITYKQQLLTYIKNDFTKDINYSTIDYTTKDLLKLFQKYNQEGNYCPRNDEKKKKEVLNLKAIAGISLYKCSLTGCYTSPGKINYPAKLSPTIGLEVEYFLPFNKNTWSIVADAVYEEINVNKTIDHLDFGIKSKVITFLIGGKYQKYFNDDFKIYINAFLIPEFNIAPVLDIYTFSTKKSEADGRLRSSAIGIGLEYKKFGFDIRYYSSRDLLYKYIDWHTGYSRISLTASYKILTKLKK